MLPNWFLRPRTKQIWLGVPKPFGRHLIFTDNLWSVRSWISSRGAFNLLSRPMRMRLGFRGIFKDDGISIVRPAIGGVQSLICTSAGILLLTRRCFRSFLAGGYSCRKRRVKEMLHLRYSFIDVELEPKAEVEEMGDQFGCLYSHFRRIIETEWKIFSRRRA